MKTIDEIENNIDLDIDFKKFPPLKKLSYCQYYKKRLREGYNIEDILRIINAFALQDFLNDVLSDVQCSQFCLLWKDEQGWDGYEDKFIYRHWMSLRQEVFTTPTIRKTIRDKNGDCPIIKIDFKKK